MAQYKCLLCNNNKVSVYGARFCEDCYYPSIDDDWQKYEDLIAEGYTRYQAKIMAGLADPDEVQEE